MELISLSIALLMSGAAPTAESPPPPARVQAIATARIVRGESISFAGPSEQATFSRSKDTFYLPMARSRQVRADSSGPALIMQEFQ